MKSLSKILRMPCSNKEKLILLSQEILNKNNNIKILEFAKKHYENKDYKISSDLYGLVFNKEMLKPWDRYRYGVALRKVGNLDLSLVILEKLSTENISSGLVSFQLSKLYSSRGAYDKALEYALHALTKDANSYRYNLQVASCNHKLKFYSDSYFYYSKALEINPKSGKVFTKLCRLYMSTSIRKSPEQLISLYDGRMSIKDKKVLRFLSGYRYELSDRIKEFIMSSFVLENAADYNFIIKPLVSGLGNADVIVRVEVVESNSTEIVKSFIIKKVPSSSKELVYCRMIEGQGFDYRSSVSVIKIFYSDSPEILMEDLAFEGYLGFSDNTKRRQKNLLFHVLEGLLNFNSQSFSIDVNAFQRPRWSNPANWKTEIIRNRLIAADSNFDFNKILRLRSCIDSYFKNGPLVLCHGDSTPSNVFVSLSSQKIKLIDFEHIYMGPPGSDAGIFLGSLIQRYVSTGDDIEDVFHVIDVVNRKVEHISGSNHFFNSNFQFRRIIFSFALARIIHHMSSPHYHEYLFTKQFLNQFLDRVLIYSEL